MENEWMDKNVNQKQKEVWQHSTKQLTNSKIITNDIKSFMLI